MLLAARVASKGFKPASSEAELTLSLAFCMLLKRVCGPNLGTFKVAESIPVL